MRRKMINVLFTLCLLFAFSVNSFADHLGTVNIGRVWFQSDGKAMNNNFQYLDSSDEAIMKARKANPGLADVLNDRITTLQPGDDVTFTINLSNEYSKATDW